MPLIAALATGLIAFVVSLLLTALAVRLGLSLGIADEPGGRRKHARRTSRLGVVPLFGAFTLAALLSRSFGVSSLDPNEELRFAGLIAGGGVVFALAIADDKLNLPPRTQFSLQTFAALVAITSQIFIERFTNPFTRQEVVLTAPQTLGPIAGYAAVVGLSLFWFLGMMNTVNFLDGVDGLASTVGVIAAGVVAIHMWREGQYSVALLPAALIGTLLGFLVFNRPPASIFLGGGAVYLGYMLACIGIIGGAKIALLLLVMGLPIADVLWQILDRARRRRSLAASDRGHLHLRLTDQGWPATRIIALYAGACALLGGAALLPLSPLAKLLTLLALFAAVIAVMARLSAQTESHQAASVAPSGGE
ncbi:MAG: undecaprenyl/decaprenyl-phosphate alpha-N-acetylglucosaminyl 1-phosphate transferase [Thermoflexales bacterium]|nr:undecaprenyl/decaprenyl-phosphate alpha-N-acetylglucosaminyl 1-phosphate transferase [Thermoflexales bacterium]MDW8351165.1 MraY family glycosyltransferase [Anaerolineae bacterium]